MVTAGEVGRLFNRRFFRHLLPFPATNHFSLGSLAPPFELLNVSSQQKLRLLDLVGARATESSIPKRPILLYFTRIFSEKLYCPLCYPHIVALNAHYEAFTQRGAEVLMIVGLDPQQSQTVMRDLGLKMPVLSDPTGRVFRFYQVGQALGAPLPAQFWVDAAGRIRFRHLFSFLEPNASAERLLVALDRLHWVPAPSPSQESGITVPGLNAQEGNADAGA